jgi:hypothetical protein
MLKDDLDFSLVVEWQKKFFLKDEDEDEGEDLSPVVCEQITCAIITLGEAFDAVETAHRRQFRLIGPKKEVAVSSILRFI